MMTAWHRLQTDGALCELQTVRELQLKNADTESAQYIFLY